ncbi:pullulanase-associated domain-containing protein [Niveibacterium sp.]|uniref:pullulanase-associated domain-containing protein n=1 Tax=Niveibacterium sp. TaxID=2017444 RepID=UPI0035B2DD33
MKKRSSIIQASILSLGVATLVACSKEEPPVAQSAPQAAAPAAVAVEQSQPVAEGAIGAVKPGAVRFHYKRAGGDYEGWGVYAWKGVKDEPPKWPGNLGFDGKDAFGVYLDIAVSSEAAMMDFLITDGTGKKDCATDQSVTFPPTIAQRGTEVWIKSGDCKVYTEQPL